jgi:hypothetical protein
MFIPIKSTNLFIYLAYKELIMPLKYHPNCNQTIQDNFPEQVLLSEHKWVNKCNVSLKVDIAQYHTTPLENGFYLLNGTIPISRIKKIWFKDEEQMILAIGNIRISSGFVPRGLIHIDNSPKVYNYDISRLKPKETINSIDFSKEIKLFS